MRTLLTGVIASFALATAFVGSASANPFDVPQVANPAVQAQLEWDANSDHAVHRIHLMKEVMSPDDQTSPDYTQTHPIRHQH